MNREKLETIYQLYEVYQAHCSIIEKYNKYIVKPFRKPNFPEPVSETIVQMILDADIPKTGDLIKNKRRIEVKCFSSTGPSSFGPQEKWNLLIFVDAINHPQIKIYKCNLANTDSEWQGIKINKNETYSDQCQAKRRPRLSFKQIFSSTSRINI